jgi:hypothetical protein
MRTLDPHLKRLVKAMSGPHAATWVVVTLPVDSWGIDAKGTLAKTLRVNYRPVSDVCGDVVYLHQHVHRAIPATADPCS